MSIVASPDIGVASGLGVADGTSVGVELARSASEAEAAGLTSWWTLGDREQAEQRLDGALALWFVARATRTMRLGLSGDVLPAHIPPGRSKQVATLDFFSNGRMEYAIDLAEPPAGLVWPEGCDDSDHVGQSLEHLAMMASLWTQERAEFHGDRFSFSGAMGLPRTVGGRIPAVHVRHTGHDSLERAFQGAVRPTGWIAWRTTPADLPDALGQLEAAASNQPDTPIRRTWFVDAEHFDAGHELASLGSVGIDELVCIFDDVPTSEQLRGLTGQRR